MIHPHTYSTIDLQYVFHVCIPSIASVTAFPSLRIRPWQIRGYPVACTPYDLKLLEPHTAAKLLMPLPLAAAAAATHPLHTSFLLLGEPP